MHYKHTQIGYLMIATLVIIAFVFGFIVAQSHLVVPLMILMIALLVIISSFTTLHVSIDDAYLKVVFGYGFFRKKFTLQKIVSVQVVKNHWYYGWGIRVWFWPKMWIYNISGCDAVEIKMKNGKIYRIGTDDPKKLENALNSAIKK